MLDVATGTAAVAIELVRQRGCRVVGLDQSAEMLASARRPGRRQRASPTGSSSSRAARTSCRFPTARSTRSRSRTSSATSRIRRRRSPSSRGSSGRAESIAGLEFGLPARASGGRSGSSTSASGCRWRVASSRRAGTRSGRFSGRASASSTRGCRSPSRSSSGARRGSRTFACGGSASAAATSSGAAGREREPARVLRARAGRLARLPDAAPSAVHAVAPLVRRDRSRAGPAASTVGAAPRRAGRVLPRGRHRSARARRAARAIPLQTRISDRTLDRAERRLDRAARSRSGSTASIAYTLWLAPLVAAGAFIVFAYNLELFGGAFHSDLWFALAWGSFPLLAAYLAVAERITVEALLAAVVRGLPEPRAAPPLDAGADGPPPRRLGLRDARARRRRAASRSPRRR